MNYQKIAFKMDQNIQVYFIMRSTINNKYLEVNTFKT